MKHFRLCLLGIIGAALGHGVTIEQYHTHDFAFSGTVTGNPFDADLKAEFQGPGGVRLTAQGFYDGGGVWKIRFSPTATGRWSRAAPSAAPRREARRRRCRSSRRRCR